MINVGSSKLLGRTPLADMATISLAEASSPKVYRTATRTAMGNVRAIVWGNERRSASPMISGGRPLPAKSSSNLATALTKSRPVSRTKENVNGPARDRIRYRVKIFMAESSGVRLRLPSLKGNGCGSGGPTAR